MGKTLLAKLGGIGVAILIGVVFLVIRNVGEEKIAESNAPETGQCLEMTGSSFSPDHNEVDCGDVKAAYKVVADNGDCDAIEANYTISLGSGDEGNVADLCLDLNAKVGECFDQGTSTTFATKVDCKSGTNKTNIFKVVKIMKSGETCANGTQPQDNAKRDVLLCLGAPA